MAYMGIMVPSKDGGEMFAIKVHPFDWRKSTGGRPCALSGYLLHHDDCKHARDETLKEVKDIRDGTYRVATV
jgi:hypothetical protein